jgi:hypothetical protein
LPLCPRDQIDDNYEELLIAMEPMSRPTADPERISEHGGEGSLPMHMTHHIPLLL